MVRFDRSGDLHTGGTALTVEGSRKAYYKGVHESNLDEQGATMEAKIFNRKAHVFGESVEIERITISNSAKEQSNKDDVFSFVWEKCVSSGFDYKSLRQFIEDKCEENDSINPALLFIYLSRPGDKLDPRTKTLEKFLKVSTLIASADYPTESAESVATLLKRCAYVYIDVFNDNYATFTEKLVKVCSEKCSAYYQAALYHDLSEIEHYATEDVKLIMLAQEYATKSYVMYFSANSDDVELMRKLRWDSLKKSCECLISIFERRLDDPRLYKRKVGQVKKYVKKFLDDGIDDYMSCHMRVFYGQLWMYDYSCMRIRRILNSSDSWFVAFNIASKLNDFNAKKHASTVIERYSPIIWHVKSMSYFFEKASEFLDRNYFAEFEREVSAKHSEVKGKIVEKNYRLSVIDSVGENYSVNQYLVKNEFTKYYENLVSMQIYGYLRAGIKPNSKMVNEWMKMASIGSENNFRASVDFLSKSKFKSILQQYAKENKKFGLYLRDVSFETQVFIKTRPRSYHFEEHTITNVNANVRAESFAHKSEIENIENILAEYNFISLANLLFLPFHSSKLANCGVTSEAEWRELAFSLIGEAELIVFIVPSGCDFESYSGIVEEREIIRLLERQDNTVCIRHDERFIWDNVETVQKVFFINEDGEHKIMSSGKYGSNYFSEDFLRSLSPLTFKKNDSYWSGYQIGTDCKSQLHLKSILDSHFNKQQCSGGEE